MSATPPKSPDDAAPASAEPWVRDLAIHLRSARDARHMERGIDMDQTLTERAEQRARWDAIEAAEAAAKKAEKAAKIAAEAAAQLPDTVAKSAADAAQSDKSAAAPEPQHEDAPPAAQPAHAEDQKALTALITQSLGEEEEPQDAGAPQMQMPAEVTYEGGYLAMLGLLEQRRAPITYGAGEALPPIDVNLTPYCTEIIGKIPEDIKRSRSAYAVKYRALARELKGLPRICHLHALLIAHLRKQSQPEHCAALFTRLWAEHADLLLEHLNARWQVSAITTFSEHGLTEGQRRCGLGLSVLLNTMKFYETERLYSGAKPKQPHSLKTQVRGRLPMEMDTYSIVNGGLDVALLGRLWIDAEQDEVIRPLAQNLLEMLNTDTRNVFRRMRIMRVQLAGQRASRAAKRRALMAAYDAAVEAEEAAQNGENAAAPDLEQIAAKAAEALASDAAKPARRRKAAPPPAPPPPAPTPEE
ncbi:hypothetical protein [Litorivita sp. NS0012-18]|uniref:hypothetical protein n=1 Tax=Litorivita sp. NS0012-18 TaxID=3127655 RepID=UPI0031047114